MMSTQDLSLTNMALVNFYEQFQPSKKYQCAQCGAHGVRLWRESHPTDPQLLCLKCAEKDQADICIFSDGAAQLIKAFESYFDKHGSVTLDTPEKQIAHDKWFAARSNQIGWYMPAVPSDLGVGYWGYTSIPQPGWLWWLRLPLAA